MSDVRITVDLGHPPEIVWRGLTERRLLSEWFIPTDLVPIPGGTYRMFPPPGLAGFTAVFDADVLEVERPRLLRMRWRGEHLHSEARWEVTPIETGSRLSVTQSGFFGLSGDQRRADLARAYEQLFRVRLPALLATLAPPLTQAEPGRARRGWWRRLARLADIPVERRMRLLSVIGAMVITVLVATALATLTLRPPQLPPQALPPQALPPAGRLPGQATQPAVQPPSQVPAKPSPGITTGPPGRGDRALPDHRALPAGLPRIDHDQARPGWAERLDGGHRAAGGGHCDQRMGSDAAPPDGPAGRVHTR